MRCTDCNRVVKPVVAIDIDGTLGDYHGHFIDFARGWLPQGRLPNHSFEENCGLDLETWRKVKLAYRQGGMKRTMPTLGNPEEFTQRLRGLGLEIWVTTTRPFNRLDNIDPDTQEWLRRNGVYYDHMLYDPDKYEELAVIVGKDRVVAVLEDLPRQAAKARELFGPRAVLLRHNTYSNYGHDKFFKTVRDLPSAYDEIRDRTGEWYANHG